MMIRQIGVLAGVATMAVLPGCIARTAVDVVTLPVKAGAKAVDWSTTSQEEADRNRGREMRKRCKENYDPNYCDR
ncbi:MAG: hypothetical protein ABW048_06600 [Sphingobium sp.]